jgi:putative ATPase
MTDLFSQLEPSYQPLAARMRPSKLAAYIGQKHLLSQDKPLRKAIEQGALHSMILWGPPGVGKTTLAKLLADTSDAHFMSISAVLSGVKEIRSAIEEAKHVQYSASKKVILFVDEVHRFNKSQQDAFLPHIEDGTFIFVGATTENPSFELNNALLSRARVYLLKNLDEEEITQVIYQALNDRENGLGLHKLVFEGEAQQALVHASNGDARRALNLLEIAVDLAVETNDGKVIGEKQLQEVLQHSVKRFDKQGDIFYDMISAFHKSVRGSSPDGALYWCCRILEGGADPLYIARRLVAIASEDIGNADPRAMQVALSAWDAFERVGPAEGERAIAQAAVYCACAPKSNKLYEAYKKCRADIRADGEFEVPIHLRNAPTSLMKDLGYGDEYRYAHDEPNAYAAGEVYLPEEIADRSYYQASERGLEIKIAEKMRHLANQDVLSPKRRYLNVKQN